MKPRNPNHKIYSSQPTIIYSCKFRILLSFIKILETGKEIKYIGNNEKSAQNNYGHKLQYKSLVTKDMFEV